MEQMNKTKAYSSLLSLAKAPFDLTQDSSLTVDRLKSYMIESPHWNFLYGFEKVNSQVIEKLCLLAQEMKVHEKMMSMQGGEKINTIAGFPSENRSVLHTASRNVFGGKSLSPESMTLSDLSRAELEKLKLFCEEIEKNNVFTDAILVGIGGSELGPHALYDALYFYRKKNRKVHFISNIDPDEVSKSIGEVTLATTLVIVVSKSGTTLETATNEAILRSSFEKEGLDPQAHFVSVTTPNSPMDNPSQYRACFHLFDCIGGRYSSTSMVGLLPLAFAYGYHLVIKLLEGAHEMDLHAQNSDPKKNIPLMAALIRIWNRNFLDYPTVAVIPYSHLLARFPAHLQQVDMESNGKRIDQSGRSLEYASGSVVWGEPGTSAQHSFFQLIHQGTDIIPVEFIGFRECQGEQDWVLPAPPMKGTTSQEKLLSNLFAQAIALAQGRSNPNPNKQFDGNRPSSILLAKKLTPKALGSLLALYEHMVAFVGFLLNVNSFDQEGVQLGKVLADQCMKTAELARKNEPDPAFPLGSALFEILHHIQ